MAHIWTFSPQSKLLLEQCLSAAKPPDESNIWCQYFGAKCKQNAAMDVDNIITVEDNSQEVVTDNKCQEENIINVLEEFTDPDIDLTTKFDDLQKKSCTTPTLLTKLTENLPTNAVNKLILYIFDSRDVSEQFLIIFFEYCLPIYIKKDNSRLCIDLLYKVHNLYPKYFLPLLLTLTKDLDVHNNIVNDVISSLNVNEQTEFLICSLNMKLSHEQFSYNLHNIYMTYKNCIPTDNIQNLTLNALQIHAEHCSSDKSYGKLFLAFLQQQKKLNNKLDTVLFHKLLDIHKSPFKRQCMSIINE